VVEQEATIQGIRMSRGIELVLVTRQKIVILQRAKPIIAKGVHVVIKVRYNEPRFNW
jgi:predicted amino acid racemase